MGGPPPRCVLFRRFRGLGVFLSRSLPVGRTNTPVGRFRRRVGFRIPNLDGPISTFRENSFYDWDSLLLRSILRMRGCTPASRSYCARQPKDYAMRYVPNWWDPLWLSASERSAQFALGFPRTGAPPHQHTWKREKAPRARRFRLSLHSLTIPSASSIEHGGRRPASPPRYGEKRWAG